MFWQSRVHPLKLWLDDVRPAPDKSWEVVTTAVEAITALQHRTYDVVSLDHDLGPVEAGTGYDVMLYLEEQAFNDLHIPGQIFFHTANPVGLRRMRDALQQIQHLKASRRSFHVVRHP